MKILLVQDFLRSGGTERQSVLLANAFAAAGHTVTLLTFRPAGPLAATLSARVTHVALQPLDTRLDWFAPRLLASAVRLTPDVVLCMGRMANCYAGALQRRLGPRTVVIATMRTGKPLPLLFRRSLRRVRHVVANSAEARGTLAHRYGVDPARTTVINNSLVFSADSAGAGDATSSSRRSLREQFGARPSTFVLLCVAMFRPEKNQRELIEIAAGLPPEIDWQLWLAGDGPARVGCEQLVRAKHCSDRVRFPGFLRDPSLLYAAADVAVHASASESLSNFLIEGQAHGLPAVAYAAQGIAECFVPGQTGWVIPRGERETFRAALEQLARATPPTRAARATAARNFARTTFDPARQVAAYLDLFEQLRR